VAGNTYRWGARVDAGSCVRWPGGRAVLTGTGHFSPSAARCPRCRESVPTLTGVKAEKDPEYLSAIAEAVGEFRDALTRLLGLYTDFGTVVPRGIAPPVVPRTT
jgi:hypothetical protein